MKKRILLIALIGMSYGVNAQNETVNGSLTVKSSVKLRTSSGSGTASFDLSGTGTYIHLAGAGLISRSNNQQDLGINGWKFRNLWLGNNAYVDGKIGIGTASPKAILDVGKFIPNETLGTVFGRLSEGNTSGDGTYLGVKGYGTQSSNYDGKSFSIVHNFYGSTNNSINFFRGGSVTGGYLTFNTNSDIERIRINGNGNVGIGTTNPDGWKLAVNGKIRAKEIKVETGWSDFVFYDNYILPTLKEVETHIKEKGHLKDIPSAKEVEKNGILLGEMDSKLLQKIEELTLYTIDQEKQLKNQTKEIQTLKKENESFKLLATKFLELEKRLEKLEDK